MPKMNIDRFQVYGTDIVNRMTGEIIYSSNESNLEIQNHCDVLNGRVQAVWASEEHLMWVPVKN
jgi:hypothetical protein